MTNILARLRLFGRQSAVLLAALLACAALSTASAAGPVSKASAEPIFCGGWLQPWGQPGDRCDAPNQGNGRLAIVIVNTSARAGCVTYIGWYGEYHHSWACAPASSQKTLYVPFNTGWHRGSIRNNNKSYSGQFQGTHICYLPDGSDYQDCEH